MHAARGKTGKEALKAMGEAYTGLIAGSRQAHADAPVFVGCDDPDIREACRTVWRNLVELAEQASGEPPEVVSALLRQAACS